MIKVCVANFIMEEYMGIITVNVDSTDKDIFNSICAKMGMNISTAVNIFIKTVNRTKKIPFEVSTQEDSLNVIKSSARKVFPGVN